MTDGELGYCVGVACGSGLYGSHWWLGFPAFGISLAVLLAMRGIGRLWQRVWTTDGGGEPK